MVLERCDASVDADVEATLKRVRESHGPLHVVVHAAGVLSDGLLPTQDQESMRRVWGAKADGAWSLHQHTVAQDHELSAFILYSSVASLFGNVGQANYSAANAYLDELARWRVRRGLSGVSIQWPAVSGVGMAAAMDDRVGIDARLSVNVPIVKRVVRQMVSSGTTSPAVQAVIPRAMFEAGMFGARMVPLLEAVQVDTPQTGSTARQGNQRERANASASSRWRGVSSDNIRQQITAQVTRSVRQLLDDAEDVDMSAPLMDMGLDSLATTQLVRELSTALEVRMSPTVMFDYPTVDALSKHLTGLLASEAMQAIDSKPSGNGAMMASSTSERDVRDVALIGMSGRFPGGLEGPTMLWEAIQSGNCMVGKVPFHRWDADAIKTYDISVTDDMALRMRWGGFVQDLEMFDAKFFSISPSDARAMDPQHRLLLEYSYLALDDAGYTKVELEGRNVGVFVGMMAQDANDLPRSSPVQNSHTSVAPGRISFTFGLRGPCEGHDTACSSAIAALNAGVSSLRQAKCELAIVAGVNAMLTPMGAYGYAVQGMTSPTGRCHTFDDRADGLARSEGCGVMVLKRANECDDGVHAVIRGVDVAHGGKSASFYAPNGPSQEKLLRAALRDADMESSQVDYVEAHGTGTPLGDPIEMNALAAVMDEDRLEAHPLVMGGVKANLGHLEAGAGAAGLIKAVMVLQRETATPNPELKSLNPKVAAVVEGFPVRFPVELEPLRQYSGKVEGEEALVAGVSSFGAYGTIAHAVISQARVGMGREFALPGSCRTV